MLPKKKMAKLTCLLRGLAKEGLISRAFFDSTRSVFECCSASMYFGVGMKMVPSTWLKVDGQSQDNFLFETQRDSVNHYTIDPKRDVQEYFFITKVDLDEVV